VLLQTKHVLRRPFCLVEIFTAIMEGIPIVPVRIRFDDEIKDREAIYSFSEQAQFMQTFETSLDASAAQVVLDTMQAEYPDQEITLDSLGRMLSKTIPQLITGQKYTQDAPHNERRMQTNNLLEAVEVATKSASVHKVRSSVHKMWRILRNTTDAAGEIQRVGLIGARKSLRTNYIPHSSSAPTSLLRTRSLPQGARASNRSTPFYIIRPNTCARSS
jgi:hypothetical protein